MIFAVAGFIMAGSKFGGQQQQIFWQAIDRYLIQKVHEVFKRWDAETATYPAKIRRASIDGIERSLRKFVHGILQRGLDTDRRLRGMGHPGSGRIFDASSNMSMGD